MTSALTKTRIEQYSRDGYLFPLDVLTQQQVEQALNDLQQARGEANERGLEAEFPMYLRTNAQIMMPFVYRLATNRALLDKIESVLGPNILLWSA